MTKKITASAVIFLTMFTSAWLVHEQNKRTYIDNLDNKTPANIHQLVESKSPAFQMMMHQQVFDKFNPREYIRIVGE